MRVGDELEGAAYRGGNDRITAPGNDTKAAMREERKLNKRGRICLHNPPVRRTFPNFLVLRFFTN
jgi:hypothetical protein